jgi:hypothetical protein
MIAGIILHPVRLLMAWTVRESFEHTIRVKVRENWWEKNHERLHHYTWPEFPGCSVFTESEMYKMEGGLYRGALDRR